MGYLRTKVPAQAAGASLGFLNGLLGLWKAHPELALAVWRGREDRIISWNGAVQSRKVDESGLLEALGDHFNGRTRCGLYNLTDAGTVSWAVIDFDSHGRKELAGAMTTVSGVLQDVLGAGGVMCHREVSKSGKGNYHLWIFFAEPVLASRVRRALKAVVAYVARDLQMDELPVEIFPKSDFGLSAAVWLPYYGGDVEKGRTIFIDKSGAQVEPTLGSGDWATTEQALREFLDEHRISLAEDNPQAMPPSEEWARKLEEDVPEGQRHNRLVSIAGHYMHRMSQGEVLTIMKLWNKHLTNPLPDVEIESTVRSLKGPEATLIFEYGAAMLTEQLPPAQDLVTGLIRARSFSIIGGEPGCGKSLAVMDLGLSIATGARRFLCWDIAKHGKILFWNNELATDEFKRRYQSKARHAPGPGDLNNFVSVRGIDDLELDIKQIRQAIEQHEPVLFVLDCLYLSHGKDESNASEMRDLMKAMLQLRDDFNLAVLAVHHTRKGGRYDPLNQELLRGSGTFSASTDMIALMRKSHSDETKRYLKIVKSRHHVDGLEPRLLSIDPISLVVRDEGPCSEDDHIGNPESTAAAATIPWPEVVHGDTTTQEVIEGCRKLGLDYSERTIKTALRQASGPGGRLAKPRHGIYRLAEV